MQQDVPQKGGQLAWRGAQIDSNYIKGIICTVIAAIIWVLASFVVQKVEDEGLSPFILSYIANSLFVVFLPLDYLREKGIFRRSTYSR
jgi:drug/metabolite transporter (DMT)-like permease